MGVFFCFFFFFQLQQEELAVETTSPLLAEVEMRKDAINVKSQDNAHRDAMSVVALQVTL